MAEIRSYKPSTEVLILAGRFQNNIELSTTNVIDFVEIKDFGKKL